MKPLNAGLQTFHFSLSAQFTNGCAPRKAFCNSASFVEVAFPPYNFVPSSLLKNLTVYIPSAVPMGTLTNETTARIVPTLFAHFRRFAKPYPTITGNNPAPRNRATKTAAATAIQKAESENGNGAVISITKVRRTSARSVSPCTAQYTKCRVARVLLCSSAVMKIQLRQSGGDNGG